MMIGSQKTPWLAIAAKAAAAVTGAMLFSQPPIEQDGRDASSSPLALCTPIDSARRLISHWSILLAICTKIALTEEAVARITVQEPCSPESFLYLNLPPHGPPQLSLKTAWFISSLLALNASASPPPELRNASST